MSNENMPYRRLGKAGINVSALSVGGWTTFGSSVTAVDDVARILRPAFEAGINFFDIADVYARGEAERTMGAVLKQFPRHELVISSKVYWPMSEDVNDQGLSRKHIIESVERSLKRIGTDYLDLYFCHRYDDDVQLEETVRAMDDLVHQGKVLYCVTHTRLPIAATSTRRWWSNPSTACSRAQSSRPMCGPPPTRPAWAWWCGVRSRRACSRASTPRACRVERAWRGRTCRGCSSACSPTRTRRA